MISPALIRPAAVPRNTHLPSQGGASATVKSSLSKNLPLWDSVFYRDLREGPKGRRRGGRRLIKLTRINGESVTVNSDLIMFVEAAGETTITLSNGERMKVREDVERLCSLVLEFKRSIFDGSLAIHRPEYES